MRTRISLAVGALVAALLPVAVSAPAHAAVPPLKMQLISISTTNTLVIAADGKLYGTGDNSHSQLCGAGPHPELSEIGCMPGAVGATAVAAGVNFNLMVATDGKPYGIGQNDQGQLAVPSLEPSQFVLMTGLPVGVTATAVAAGTSHSLVLGSDGIVYGSGDNLHGQLTGTGDKATLTPLTGLPVGVTATAIAAGTADSMVLGSDGVVYGAGSNSDGQITGGGSDVNTLTAFVNLPVGVTATAIAMGDKHSLVLGNNGVAYAAGDNAFNQLAANGGNDLAILLPMAGLPNGVTAVAVAAGTGHSVVLGSDGRLFGAGANADGQLTNTPNPSTALAPMHAVQGAAIDAIAAGGDATLKRDTDSIVYGTGENGNQVLTTNAPATANLFVPLAGQQLAAVGQPVISGTPKVGLTMSVSTGSWLAPPTSYQYQWRRGVIDIPGATNPTYKATAADLGKSITVRVQPNRSGFVSGLAVTAPVVVKIGSAPVYTGTPKPTVVGVAKVGRIVGIKNLKLSGFKPTPTAVTYRWLRAGKPITGATKAKYKITRADKGKRISVRISTVLAGYATGSYTTASVKVT